MWRLEQATGCFHSLTHTRTSKISSGRKVEYTCNFTIDGRWETSAKHCLRPYSSVFIFEHFFKTTGKLRTLRVSYIYFWRKKFAHWYWYTRCNSATTIFIGSSSARQRGGCIIPAFTRKWERRKRGSKQGRTRQPTKGSRWVWHTITWNHDFFRSSFTEKRILTRWWK